MVFFADTNGGTHNCQHHHVQSSRAVTTHRCSSWPSTSPTTAWPITTGSRPTSTTSMHSGLTGGFAGLTGDASQIKAGDNTVSRLVPMIMASRAYKDGGVIILWWDESETDGEPGDNADDFNHTIGEIVISDLAHPNEGGLPYASSIDYSHSSDLRTMQEIFHVKATGSTSPFLGDAANANDLSDLFEPGVIPSRP